MAPLFFRCSDGHLFTASRLKISFLSVHLIDRVWLRCPVDHRWRTAKPVKVHEADGLPDHELEEAMRHRF
jgi:hypothetical protein